VALVQFGGNEELIEESPFENVLKKSLGKTLQLAISPKLKRHAL
jgi:hypothetical protein